MSSSDAVTEAMDADSSELGGRAASLAEVVGPKLARHAGSGNLAAVSGVVSLARAGRTFLKGDRKRGVAQALGGLFWLGVALAQRRSGGSDGSDGHGRGRSPADLDEVADTSPDVADAVEPGGRETDHATGEEVVDTTDADVEDVETREDSPDVPADVDTEDVDQRDVAESTDVGDAVEAEEDDAGAGDESETAAESAGEGEDPAATGSAE